MHHLLSIRGLEVTTWDPKFSKTALENESHENRKHIQKRNHVEISFDSLIICTRSANCWTSMLTFGSFPVIFDANPSTLCQLWCRPATCNLRSFIASILVYESCFSWSGWNCSCTVESSAISNLHRFSVIGWTRPCCTVTVLARVTELNSRRYPNLQLITLLQ